MLQVIPPLETPDLQAEIVRLVRGSTLAGASRALGLPRETVARLFGGLPVREGTVALAEKRMAALLAYRTDSNPPPRAA